MDRGAAARKRRKASKASAPQPARPPPNAVREKRQAQSQTHSSSAHTSSTPSSRVAASRTSNEIARARLRGSESVAVSQTEDDSSSINFTVSNVGTGGKLYLKPARQPSLQNSPVFPTTPPQTSDGAFFREEWSAGSQNDASYAAWAPKLRGAKYDQHVPLPPGSMARLPNRQHNRSRSWSTLGDRRGSVAPESALDANRMLHHSKEQVKERPKSSLDYSGGFLRLHIPHYRLGSPRFSERGTAYLHSSLFSNNTDEDDEQRISFLSQRDYDRLFPLPPGQAVSGAQSSNVISAHPSRHHLHPSAAHTTNSPRSRSRSQSPSQAHQKSLQNGASTVFDRIEANPNDPLTVRYSPHTGRIIAATIPRIIVQITSPRFLDYELLSDFFLTFRCFLPPDDLLDWLCIRMRWAFSNASDAGRIVSVRTFVALRHWILNYFANDFLHHFALRQHFCDSVNALAQDLVRRSDRGGSDLDIIGELKKCWRRTSALYWPVDDSMNPSPIAFIVPGGYEHGQLPSVSASNLPPASEQELSDGSQQDVVGLSYRENGGSVANTQHQAVQPPVIHEPLHVPLSSSRRSKIPASPMSEDSFHALSCSMPFLQHLRVESNAGKRLERKEAGLHRQDSLTTRGNTATNQHQRQGSLSDTIRNETAPPRNQPTGTLDLAQVPDVIFTGGLVRGLLLQPSTAQLDLRAPRSPTLDPVKLPGLEEEDYFDEATLSHGSVKRLVGDVRRALSVNMKKPTNSESSARSHHSSKSTGSNFSRLHIREESRHKLQSSASGRSLNVQPVVRFDALAAKVEKSYRSILQSHALSDARDLSPQEQILTIAQHPDNIAVDKVERSDSHGAQGSRYNEYPDRITTHPNAPSRGADFSARTTTSSEITPQPSLGGPSGAPNHYSGHFAGVSASSTRLNHRHHHGSIDGRLKEALDSHASSWAYDNSHQSHPQTSEAKPPPNPLRRRPGGDLKAADHVRQLEWELQPRPTTEDFLSSSLNSLPTSGGADSRDLSGTHFSGQNFDNQLASLRSAPDARNSMGLMNRTSSEPHLRPSFRADAQRLAKVPDRLQGGGVEDALLKLEGKGTDNDEENIIAGSAEAVKDDRRSYTSKAQPSHAIAGFNFQIPNAEREQQYTRVHRISQADFSSVEPGAPGTFLLDDNESLSEISTDIAEDADEVSAGVRSFFFDDTIDEDARPTITFRSPPTPPSTIGASQEQSPERSIGRVFQAPSRQRSLKVVASAPKLLDPTSSYTAAARRSEGAPNQIQRALTPPHEQEPAHLPFILGFESEVIAEQLCIIEKDALDEMEWKDLISLQWQQSPSHVRNWVDYLKRGQGNGIDLVIARFNLVVKWVVSECVLTSSMEERARCMAKYIHVAAHCLRLRNYASLYQLTLALLSADLSRLQGTWALVPAADRALLARLETLCAPMRNFANLRAEMESGGEEQGCIPLLALYTHDLSYNAQKPARVDAVPPGPYQTHAPLVNFDRWQTAAAITKNLLRLLDAGAKYVFRPNAEVLSRCLWLAALEDGEINERSRRLE